ncbi:unnamed protein product [Clonostachys chloroleuca]|uniref:Uncharacterized protein n=1 Tax=Clonostachys chloroleuca TaxID=1926264 RepID=A0AA35MBJ9_9HYPO|nr:unnamed protein product [Clonostachys chloroleuca]
MAASLAPAAPIELVPNELLDAIMDHLAASDLVNLWKCSTQLSYRTLDALFRSPEACSRSMLMACKTGDVCLIRATLSHGADVDIITIDHSDTKLFEDPDHSRMIMGPEVQEFSTLVLTAKRKHNEAFIALLDLGANPSSLDKSQRKNLAKAVRRGSCEPMLRRLMNAETAADPLLTSAKDGINLVALMRRGASLSLLEALIDKGGDPNGVTRGSDKTTLRSPLSQAIEMGSVPALELLMVRGADVQGRLECFGMFHHRLDVPFVYRRPDHIPIFAAAARMARTGRCDMMDLCLGFGADINMIAPAFLGNRFMSVDLAYGKFFAMTPLLFYLEEIQRWPVNTGLDPVSGIAYFIERDASVELAEKTDVKGAWMEKSEINPVAHVSALEILLYKWDLRGLKEEQLFNTVRHLVELGSGATRSFEILTEFGDESQQNKQRPGDSRLLDEPEDAPPAWWIIASLIVDKAQQVHPDDFRWLLSTYPVESGTRAIIEAGSTEQYVKDAILSSVLFSMSERIECFGAYQRLILDRIQATGADINGFLGEEHILALRRIHNGPGLPWDEDDTGSRALHRILSSVRRRIEQVKHFPKWFVSNMKESVRAFCLDLIERGADPHLLVHGRTAMGILTDTVSCSLPVSEPCKELARTIEDAHTRYLKNQKPAGL